MKLKLENSTNELGSKILSLHENIENLIMHSQCLNKKKGSLEKLFPNIDSKNDEIKLENDFIKKKTSKRKNFQNL